MEHVLFNIILVMGTANVFYLAGLREGRKQAPRHMIDIVANQILSDIANAFYPEDPEGPEKIMQRLKASK